ncbi:MAG: hypothetical protein ACRCZ0_00540 [Cetobacterium sp.]
MKRLLFLLKVLVILTVLLESLYGKDSNSLKKFTSEIESLPGKLEFQNRLKSLNGKIVTSSSRYKPGDMITYEVSLKNLGEGFLKDVGIDANLDSVKAILAGSDVESVALENVDIAIKASHPRTVITSKMGDSRRWIKKRLKFAPKSSVTFSISGRISDKAVGSLSGMEFKVGDEVKTAESISSSGASISGEKTLLEPKDGIYTPGDRLKYILTIKNSGDGYGRSVSIQDILSEVTVEREGKRYGRAFSNWKVSYLGAKASSSKFKKYTFLKNEVLGKEDLNTKVDIGPDVAIQFLVEADIDPDAVGTIESRAKIAGGTSEAGTIYLKPDIEYAPSPKVDGGVRLKLTSNKGEMKIGEVVGITVTLENRTDKTFQDLTLKNLIPRGFKYLDEEFEKLSLNPREKFTKTFYLKASIGVNGGKNTFQSSVLENSTKISNSGEIDVEIVGDALLNTATIIGKVIDERTGLGIPHAVVYTPSGVVVESDEYGRFHLPDAWTDKTYGENFSLKLDEASLPYESVVKSENPMVKRISPYSLTKFNFIVKTPEVAKEREVEKSKLEYSGTGFIDAYIGEGDRPRAVYFGKMKYGDSRLTLHFDTREKQWGESLEKTYGDSSKVREEVAPIGKLYLKFEYKESSILFGKYETGFLGTRFSDYNKELSGLKAEFKDGDINFKVFLSTPNAMYAHEEFLGTGGSLYFLKNGDIVKSSQKVMIKVVDSDSHVVEKMISLQEGRDYEIDPFLGRVILTSPLNGGGSHSSYAYLVVDYSYLEKDGKTRDSSNSGFKVLKNINDNLEVGATSIHESRGKSDYDLKGVQMRIHDAEGNYLEGEFSRSRGVSNVNNYLSFDGGLTFLSVDSDDDTITGDAYRVTGAYRILEVAELKAWYEQKEAGYSFASDLGDRFFRTFGTELEYQHSREFKSYWKLQYIDEMRWGLKRETEVITSSRFEYLLNESTKIYSEIKAGISNSISLGAQKRINDRFKIEAKNSFTKGAYNFEAGADYQLYQGYNIYSGYSSDGEISRDKYTLGQRARIGERTSLYAENQFFKEQGKSASIQGYGLDYDYRYGATIGGAIQYGDVILPHGVKNRRRAVSLYSRMELDKFTLKNRVEFREEDGDEKVRQFFTQNSLEYRYSHEYSFSSKLNYSFTHDSSLSSYLEASLGFAYRPIHNDRLNYLSRYTMILDSDSRGAKDFSAYIGEVQTIYSFSNSLDFSLKNGYRREFDTYLNELYLLGIKANYTLLDSWEVFGQYQMLLDRANQDILNGAIFGIYKNVHTNMKFGGGYNFSGFKDSLGEQDYRSDGWFLNIVGSM